MGAIHHSQGVLLQILSVFTLQSLLYPSCTKPHFSLALFYVFFLCWCIHLSPRALQGMITLSSVLRFLQCVPPPPSLTFSHFLLMAVVLLPLPLFSITLLLSHSRSVPSVLVLSHGPWPPIMTPAAVTLVHSTVYLVEVSAEATNMSCKLFLFSQHKSTCVWIDPVACKSSISLGVCAYMVDPVAW